MQQLTAALASLRITVQVNVEAGEAPTGSAAASSSSPPTTTGGDEETFPVASDIIPDPTYKCLVGGLSSKIASAGPVERIDKAFELGVIHRRELLAGRPLSADRLWRLSASYWVCVTDQPVSLARSPRHLRVKEVRGKKARWVAFASVREAEAYCWAWGREGFEGLSHL